MLDIECHIPLGTYHFAIFVAKSVFADIIGKLPTVIDDNEAFLYNLD